MLALKTLSRGLLPDSPAVQIQEDISMAQAKNEKKLQSLLTLHLRKSGKAGSAGASRWPCS